jgi:hypothetical protein
MPTLELLKLQLKPGVSSTSPTLLSVLSDVRAFVKTGSHFFTCIEDNSLLYILGEWSSLSAHKTFLASLDRAKVLAPQDDLAEFVWCLHINMPDHMPSCLPLDAPVISLARFFVKPDESTINAVTKHTDKFRDEIAMGSASDKVFDGWRIDAAEGEKELVVISGWDSTRHHLEWSETQRRDVPEYGRIGKYFDLSKGDKGLEVVHLRDIEKIGGGS